MVRPKHKILVTGGAGFIGSHTVEQLLLADKEVVVLDNLSSGKLANLDLTHPNLSFIEGDILELPLLADIVADCDVVLHLAAITSVPLSIENPIYCHQVNVQGLLHLLHTIQQTNACARLVYASSAAVYGEPSRLPCTEDEPLSAQTLSPYALQKIHDEEYALLYQRMHGLETLGLRYFNVYGPRQDANSSYSGVITRFIYAYRAGQPLTVFGDGEQARDFIHVQDIARANVLAVLAGCQGILNIATGQSQTLRALIDHISALGGKPAEVIYKPKRQGDIKNSYANIAKAQSLLNFNAEVSFAEGIKRLCLQAGSGSSTTS